jgi:hypothetical protein
MVIAGMAGCNQENCKKEKGELSREAERRTGGTRFWPENPGIHGRRGIFQNSKMPQNGPPGNDGR